MIQRKQTLWLLLSAICAFLSYLFPFFSGTRQGNSGIEKATVDAITTFPLMVLTGITLLLSLITIFLYKKRKLQIRLCIAGVLLVALIIVLYFSEIKDLSGSIALSSVFVFIMPISYIMAALGIRKDDKTVKALDRLR